MQVVQVDEIAFPALGLLERLNEKRERRGKEEVAENEDGEEVEEVDGPEENVERPGKYPRGLVRVRVSDGHGRDWDALEGSRVVGLGLEEMRLGCKVSAASLSLCVFWRGS